MDITSVSQRDDINSNGWQAQHQALFQRRDTNSTNGDLKNNIWQSLTCHLGWLGSCWSVWFLDEVLASISAASMKSFDPNISHPNTAFLYCWFITHAERKDLYTIYAFLLLFILWLVLCPCFKHYNTRTILLFCNLWLCVNTKFMLFDSRSM